VRTPEQDVLRRVAAWPSDGVRTTTLYLDVDGRRWPRRRVYLKRADDLLRRARDEAETLGRDVHRAAGRDRDRVLRYVRDLERSGPIRGVAAFSCGGERFEGLALSRPIRDQVRLGDRPYVLPLEALVETAETFCTAIVDREKARFLISRLGRVEEITSILDDVPGRHDQGGRAQARLGRHIEDHVQRHIKHVGEVLLRVQQDHPFDHLVLAGPEEAMAELERELHDYLRRKIVGRLSLAISAPASEVLERTVALEQELEARREREAVEQLAAELEAGAGRATAGMEDTIAALEASRVETLVILPDLEARGVRCTSCGHLATSGERCGLCGSETVGLSDLGEVALEEALRRRCRVETVPSSGDLERLGGIGALLRF
jgi:peptide chain release factor subunit 1